MAIRRLTQIEVLALQETDHAAYHIRLFRLERVAPALVWEGQSSFFIQRVPANKARKLPERLVVIVPRDYEWAEGSWQDVQPDGNVVVEDYLMEIYALVDGN